MEGFPSEDIHELRKDEGINEDPALDFSDALIGGGIKTGSLIGRPILGAIDEQPDIRVEEQLIGSAELVASDVVGCVRHPHRSALPVPPS